MPASPINDLPRPLAIVCHDAGAANIILHAVPKDKEGLRIFVRGPAERIAVELGHPTNVESLEAALEGATALLSGTGWADDLEHRARVLATERNIFSIAVLDHWVNYHERFTRAGVEALPHRWWVTDAYAMDEARRHFDTCRIDLVPNLYAARQLSTISPIASDTEDVLLYILEPARSDWGKSQPGEFQALDYFVETLSKLGLPDTLKVVLRPHPADPPKKYEDWVQRQSGIALSMDRSPSISNAIGRSRWVAGCESFGLTLALGAGRPVFCTLPPHAPACRLPHDKIIHIKTME
jgi:hypothetical protein